jgi:hypothetical protein
MRKIMVLAFALVALLAAAGSASAYQWNPQGGPTGPFSGVVTLTVTDNAANNYGTYNCAISGYITTSGDTATTTDASGTAAGPVWSSCSNNWSTSANACITSSSAWTLRVFNLSGVIESGINMVVKVGTGSTCSSPFCTETVTSGFNDSGWDNATHELTEDALYAPLSVTGSGFFCGGRLTLTGSLGGTITMPSTVTIS